MNEVVALSTEELQAYNGGTLGEALCTTTGGAIGAKVGAEIGASIGSSCGPVGAAVGLVVGVGVGYAAYHAFD